MFIRVWPPFRALGTSNQGKRSKFPIHTHFLLNLYSLDTHMELTRYSSQIPASAPNGPKTAAKWPVFVRHPRADGCVGFPTPKSAQRAAEIATKITYGALSEALSKQPAPVPRRRLAVGSLPAVRALCTMAPIAIPADGQMGKEFGGHAGSYGLI